MHLGDLRGAAGPSIVQLAGLSKRATWALSAFSSELGRAPLDAGARAPVLSASVSEASVSPLESMTARSITICSSWPSDALPREGRETALLANCVDFDAATPAARLARAASIGVWQLGSERIREHAAIDEQCGASDIAAGVGTEQQRDAGDFLRAAPALEGGAVGELLLLILV